MPGGSKHSGAIKNVPPKGREGELLEIGGEAISFARNIVVKKGSAWEIQPRLFVNDPWELIAEAVHRAVPEKDRDIAHSFRRQAEDYFRAASLVRELAVRPVLLYYAFLNLAKTYAIAKGNRNLLGKASHGVSAEPKSGAVLGSLVKFQKGKGVKVFQELLPYFGGDASITSRDLRLGDLLPQTLPGHRLWCYATNKAERFVEVRWFEVLHSSGSGKNEAWLNIHLDRSEAERLGNSESEALSGADFRRDFEVASDAYSDHWTCFQQRTPATYAADPLEALAKIDSVVRARTWETVRIESPYRKPYVYLCPSAERKTRLPQLLSVYLLRFFLSSVTRYVQGYFEALLESKFGHLFSTFISESPGQFLNLMASEILGREVSKPAII